MFWKKPKPDLQPQWLIVGLGNPGGEYAGTRHNVGFEVVEELCERYRIKLGQSKHRARFGVGVIDEIPVCLVRPLTYMNLSGQAVAPIARAYRLTPDHILVVADDLDLPLGKLRLREDGSAGGHNGHKSLIQSLGTQAYPRIRIGIGRAAGAIDHVLGPFKQGEREAAYRAILAAADACVAMVSQSLGAAQQVVTAFNKGPEVD